MERLTEWIDNGEDQQAVPKMDLRNNGHQRCCNKLAELEDLQEQGLLLELHCKVGDVIYLIVGDIGEDEINEKKLIEEEQIRAYAEIYAKNLILYGVDVREKLETATQMSYALDKAYMRGRQDGTDTNVGGKWIPVEERLPEEDKYILLSFANFTLPAIGKYEENNDGSGNFYLGDEDKTLLSYGLIVNAWMPLPEPYKEE